MRHSRHVCCVTQQTCLLCHTADMSAVSHGRHVCCATQQACLLSHTADTPLKSNYFLLGFREKPRLDSMVPWVFLTFWMHCDVLDTSCRMWDLLESLVTVIVFNVLPTGSTGFTGPCDVSEFLNVLLCSWCIFQHKSYLFESVVLVRKFNEILTSSNGFSGPCNVYEILNVLQWSL